MGGHHIRKQCNNYKCHQWRLTGVFYPGLIPGLTFLTVIEVGGNLQKSASLVVVVMLKTFGTKLLISELENMVEGDH